VSPSQGADAASSHDRSAERTLVWAEETVAGPTEARVEQSAPGAAEPPSAAGPPAEPDELVALFKQAWVEAEDDTIETNDDDEASSLLDRVRAGRAKLFGKGIGVPRWITPWRHRPRDEGVCSTGIKVWMPARDGGEDTWRLVEVLPPHPRLNEFYARRFWAAELGDCGGRITVMCGQPLAEASACRTLAQFDLPMTAGSAQEPMIEIALRERDNGLVQIQARDLSGDRTVELTVCVTTSPH
jgi:hypothetical protein